MSINAKDPVISAIQLKREQLHNALRILDEMEKQAADIVAIGAIGVIRPKAPAGELRGAIVKALRGAGAVMSADLKKRVVAGGYDHHINGQYFTKTLKSLVKEKAVKKVPNGAFSTYELRK